MDVASGIAFATEPFADDEYQNVAGSNFLDATRMCMLLRIKKEIGILAHERFVAESSDESAKLTARMFRS